MSAHVVLDEGDDGWSVDAHHLGNRPLWVVTDDNTIHLDIGAPESGNLTVTLDAPEPVAQ